MTESEKARAYDEALKKAKNVQETSDSNVLVDWMEYIFPELAESKDEKIRKALIEMVHDTTGDELWIDYDVHKEDALAWLEKQSSSSVKWQKNTPDNKPTINHSVLMKTTHGVAEGYFVGSLWFQFRWSSNIKDSDVLAWMELSDLNEQGEQKSSNVDYYQVDDEVGNLNDWVITTSHDKVEPKFKVGDMVCKKKDNSFCATINSITDTVYLCDVFDSDGDYDDDYAFLISEQDEYELVEKIKPQSAWSDEDEEMYKIAFSCIETLEDISNGKNMHADVKDWFKSLKDRIGG